MFYVQHPKGNVAFAKFCIAAFARLDMMSAQNRQKAGGAAVADQFSSISENFITGSRRDNLSHFIIRQILKPFEEGILVGEWA